MAYFFYFAQQILLVAARKVISGAGDLNRKGEKCRDSKETFRNRVYIRCLGRAILVPGSLADIRTRSDR